MKNKDYKYIIQTVNEKGEWVNTELNLDIVVARCVCKETGKEISKCHYIKDLFTIPNE